MQSQREKLTRLRQLMGEAIPLPPSPSASESDAWRRYQAFAENDPLPNADTSCRARQVRNINRIAIYYNWHREVQDFLDRHDVAGMGSLDDDQIAELNQHMAALENCLQHGCDPPGMPAAR